MPPPLNVDREAVRTLAVAVGVREAARQMNIPEATVQAWSARGNWSVQIEAAKAAHVQRLEAATKLQPKATKPADALVNVMNDRKDKSRFLLSKYVVNAAKVASRSRSPLKDAQNVRHVAGVMSAIWPEEQGSRGLTLNLGVAIGGME